MDNFGTLKESIENMVNEVVDPLLSARNSFIETVKKVAEEMKHIPEMDIDFKIIRGIQSRVKFEIRRPYDKEFAYGRKRRTKEVKDKDWPASDLRSIIIPWFSCPLLTGDIKIPVKDARFFNRLLQEPECRIVRGSTFGGNVCNKDGSLSDDHVGGTCIIIFDHLFSKSPSPCIDLPTLEDLGYLDNSLSENFLESAES